MQWMLPYRGHSLVVLTNENESPARYALGLSVLDFLLGVPPPTPSWSKRFARAAVDERIQQAAADVAIRKRIEAITLMDRTHGSPPQPPPLAPGPPPHHPYPMQATPSAGRQPRFALSAYVGSYVHPAYGNATLSMSVDAEDGKVIGGHRPRSSTLQLCGAATLAHQSSEKP